MKIIKDILQNKQKRLEILLKCKTDLVFRSYIIEKCRRDPLFFINYFVFTYDPRIVPNSIPFITYEYQDTYILELIECVRKGMDNSTEKSRDMGFSWMIIAICIWALLFQEWSILYGNRKEDYVDKKGDMDSFFERCRFVLKRIPKWMKPIDLQDTFMNISTQEKNAQISGDAGDGFGIGGRRTWVIMDEFSYWRNDRKAWMTTRDVTKCRTIGGTPEGTLNVYGKIMVNDKEFRNLEIKKFRLHWSIHPKKTKEWYEEEKKKRTPLEVAKQLDISYENSVSGAVYPTFYQSATFGAYTFNPKLKLYTAWDFGRDTTAIIWWQKDYSTNSIYIVDAFSASNKDINFFAPFVIGKKNTDFTYTEEESAIIRKHLLWKHKYAGHFGDPYNGNSKQIIGHDATVVSELAEHGINMQLTSRKIGIKERINKATAGFRRTFINEELTDFIVSIVQSHYPKENDNSQNTTEKDKPVHDDNSHFRTAMEYMYDAESEMQIDDIIIDSPQPKTPRRLYS